MADETLPGGIPEFDDNTEVDPGTASHFTIIGEDVDPTAQADEERMEASIDHGGTMKHDEANDISDITESEEAITHNAIASIVDSESEPGEQVDTQYDLDTGEDDYHWEKSDDPAVAGDEFERRPSPYFRNDDTGPDTFTDDAHRADPERRPEEDGNS